MKKYLVFAGVNGAGKTSLYQTNEGLFNMPRVNIDEIVRRFGSWKDSADVMKAGRIAVDNIKEYMNSGISFNQETTLCGRTILRTIRKCKELGYTIEMYYVGVNSADIAVERVAQRVANGGHGIPEQDIRRRYDESLRNLKNILPLCDYVRIFDNTESFRLIATFVSGKCIDHTNNIPGWCKGLI